MCSWWTSNWSSGCGISSGCTTAQSASKAAPGGANGAHSSINVAWAVGTSWIRLRPAAFIWLVPGVPAYGATSIRIRTTRLRVPDPPVLGLAEPRQQRVDPKQALPRHAHVVAGERDEPVPDQRVVCRFELLNDFDPELVSEIAGVNVSGLELE